MSTLTIDLSEFGKITKEIKIEGRKYTVTKPMAGHQLSRSQILAELAKIDKSMQKESKSQEPNEEILFKNYEKALALSKKLYTLYEGYFDDGTKDKKYVKKLIEELGGTMEALLGRIFEDENAK